MHSLSPGSNYIIHTITYILLFLGQIICSRNSCHSRKYLVISALVIGSREIIPEHFEHVTHAQACQHFSPFIRESFNTTTIQKDNLPTVHAWKRLKAGGSFRPEWYGAKNVLAKPWSSIIVLGEPKWIHLNNILIVSLTYPP